MKSITIKVSAAIALLTMATAVTKAQDVKESVQPLSKSATKGFIYNVEKDGGGSTTVTYKIPGDKKSPNASFEAYAFDPALKMTSDKTIDVPKEPHADRERTWYNVSVGGCSSFEILSMKLKLTKVVAQEVWSQESQKYYVKKYISRETIKAKNDNGTVYYGYASYGSSDITNNNLFNLARIESKDKAKADKYYILDFNESMEIKEKPVDVDGSYSLVYCDQLKNENVILIFAPNKGAADLTKYMYLEYTLDGTLKNKVEFKSPVSAMLITASFDEGGSVYLCGSSAKGTDPFNKTYSEYAPIENPCFTEANNKIDMYWIKASEEKMDNFHLLKFKGDKLVFIATTPVSEFKNKFKTPPAGKGADPYKGSKFYIENFYVTAQEDYLITGQLTSRVNMGNGVSAKAYGDMVCLHFDKNGGLKAEYGVQKMYDDKKSEIFEMKQNFIPSADGKTLYWEILEVKGDKGYEGFMDAYNGNPTFYAKYFPRIGKIDLSNSTVSDFKVLGNGKYFLNKHFTGRFDEKEKSITYTGHDEDRKNLWLGKAVFN